MKEGWVNKKVADCFKVKSGDFLSNKLMNLSGNYDVYGGNGIAGKHDDFNLDGENIVIGRVGAKCGNVRLTNEKLWLTDNAFFISEYYDEFDKKYLTQLLGYLELGKTANHAAQPVISYTTIKPVELKYPKDVKEQKRIVGILDEAFEGIDKAIANTEKNIANARELFDSTSKSLFVESDRWQKYTLGDLLELEWIISHLDGNHGGDYPHKNEFVAYGVPYISANCISNNKVNFNNAKFLSEERAAVFRKGVAKNNDVLFAHNATVGPVALLYTSLEKVILSTSLTYYRCNNEYIIPEYLAHFMRSPLFTDQYSQVMRQSTRNQVPITKQREFYHIIPPINKQKQIAQELDNLTENLNTLENIYQKKLEALTELKQSLLKKAFEGEI